MDKHGPAPHVLVFYWCVLLIDVTSVRLGRFLDRRFARKSKPKPKPKPRDPCGHGVGQAPRLDRRRGVRAEALARLFET